MPNKYYIDWYQYLQNLLPVNKRLNKFIVFGKVLVSQIKWLHINIFSYFYDGATFSYWDISISYTKGTYIKGLDKSIYYCIADSPAGQTVYDVNYWLPINSEFIGAKDRVRFTSQKVIFEYALNTWFDYTFQNPPLQSPLNSVSNNTIYISANTINPNVFVIGQNLTNSSVVGVTYTDSKYFVGLPPSSFVQNDFTINYQLSAIPSYLTSTEFEKQIRAFADKLVLAGTQYNIQSY
jgi:hypothetical protein